MWFLKMWGVFQLVLMPFLITGRFAWQFALAWDDYQSKLISANSRAHERGSEWSCLCLVLLLRAKYFATSFLTQARWRRSSFWVREPLRLLLGLGCKRTPRCYVRPCSRRKKLENEVRHKHDQCVAGCRLKILRNVRR